MLPRPPALQEQKTLRPWGQRPGSKAVTDLLNSLDIFSFLICESEEDNRPVLIGLLRPFNPLGPPIPEIFYLLR